MADRLVAVDDSTYLFPPAVQAAYLANVQEIVTDTVADLDDVATAVANKVAPLTSDGQVAPLVTTATSTRAALDGRYIVHAPAPSGGDDTAMLQALINTAAAAGGTGTIYLGYGTYKTTGLTTSSGFYQPRIIGRGKQHTTIKSTNAANPVIQFIGIGGSISSGAILDLTIAGTDTTTTTAMNGIGIELVGCGGVQIRAQFTNLATGLRYHNRDTDMFTEFCIATDSNWNYCNVCLEYKVTNGNESFHGSGVDGNSIMGMPSGGTAVVIGTNAFPYNAPMNVTIFPVGAGGNIISTANTARPAVAFFGNIRIEIQEATAPFAVAGGIGNNVFLAGTVQVLGGYTRLGKLYMIEKLYWSGPLAIPQLRPWQRSSTLGSGTTNLMTGDPLYGPGAYLVEVSVQNPSATYFYAYTLIGWQSPVNSGGTATILATHATSNGTSAGAPTFGWSGGLTVTNPNYAGYVAEISVVPFHGYNGVDNLGQY